MSSIPEQYIGREPAFVKHTILRSYLLRLFMIVGQSSKIPVINYVDCMSGPWQEGDEELRDTSIGVSLQQIAECQAELEKRFGRQPKFRALYIEKNKKSFLKLNSFLVGNPYPGIETHCMRGDYVSLTDDIVNWCGDEFTFFFVDPKGWKGVVDARVMQPLLQMKRAELLINLMYDFVNRAYSIPKHAEDMEVLFGDDGALDGGERKIVIPQRYRRELKQVYQGRTAMVPIDKGGVDRVLYFLVYLTRDATGIRVFKEIAEDMEIVQRQVKQEARLRKQQMQSSTEDMFGDAIEGLPDSQRNTENILAAKEYLSAKLSGRVAEINREVWADFLEESDLYPSDLQAGMKELVSEGVAKNLSCDVSRRTKKVIKTNCYPGKGERWQMN